MGILFHPFKLYAQFHLLAACKKQHDEADLIGTDPGSSGGDFIICTRRYPKENMKMERHFSGIQRWLQK